MTDKIEKYFEKDIDELIEEMYPLAKEDYPELKTQAWIGAGFEDAMIGIGERAAGSMHPSIAYDRQKVIDIMAEEYQKDIDSNPDQFDEDDDGYTMAEEWFGYNTFGGYLGEHTPVFITTFESAREEFAFIPKKTFISRILSFFRITK